MISSLSLVADDGEYYIKNSMLSTILVALGASLRPGTFYFIRGSLCKPSDYLHSFLAPLDVNPGALQLHYLKRSGKESFCACIDFLHQSRVVKRIIRPMFRFKSFCSASRTLSGVKLTHMTDVG